ncbi:hypothetical protein [Bradyrhizobium sp. ERR14]|uniref:hypothetical protein n=1 Tax=Bradyrhizobium sp. ERR14 TaxID=2663837 RepID=UPI00161DBE16|nr:hypothetical protein [Bradyrhizobium sp. ERR14]MBB4398700.1 hypothetical protein [Bradyrhizobium sp. ERR14]
MSDKTIRTPELNNVKKATAIMFAALVKSLEEVNPGLKEAFVAKLDEGYAKIRNDTDDLNALELLSWTRTMITGFDLTGESKAFFD